MCETLKILPLNHCLYGKNQFAGGFTYFKANKKSQIDFVVTDNAGRKQVTDLELVTSGWHFSDHIPIDLRTRNVYEINSLALLIRSKSLVEPSTPNRNNSFLKLYHKDFNCNMAK